MKINPSYFGIKNYSQKIAAIIGIADIAEAKISHHGKALTPDTVISFQKLSAIFLKLRLTYTHFWPAKGWGSLLDRVLFLEPWPEVCSLQFCKRWQPETMNLRMESVTPTNGKYNMHLIHPRNLFAWIFAQVPHVTTRSPPEHHKAKALHVEASWACCAMALTQSPSPIPFKIQRVRQKNSIVGIAVCS